jgi:TolB protein
MKNILVQIATYLIMFYCLDVYADIAFVANVDGNWDLFTVEENGDNLTRLTNTSLDEKDPSWSPDGKKIVYATTDGHLNLIDLEAGETKRVEAGDEALAKINPSFSPSGKEIAYIQFRPAAEKDDTDLMVFALETGKAQRVLDQVALQMWPAWSPDGNRLVYASMHCSGDCGRIIQELWIADPRGGWARQLLLTHSLCQQPSWSPNGKRITFSSDKSGNYDIWVVDLETWALEQITVDQGLDVKPAWSPDGKKMAFVSTRSGIMEIWIKELESGELRRLRPFGERDVECKDVAW